MKHAVLISSTAKLYF